MAGTPRPRPSRAAGAITARQREVLDLIARGLTNKEIAHSLGITERGVAAHVSRLLVRFRVPNRAGLIASTLSDALGGSRWSALASARDQASLPPTIERELEAYSRSAFMIGLTVGPDNVLVYANEAGKKIFGIGPESVASTRFATRRASAETEAFRAGARQAFETGHATTVENQSAAWLRDDGSRATGRFSCVLQPVREAAGGVLGILWICMRGLESSSQS